MSESSSSKIRRLIGLLHDRYGEISWWPGTRDEVMIGAILTQQTRWENVNRALQNLKEKGLCTLTSISHADIREIEDAIRCTGFYRVKAKRLQALAARVAERSAEELETMPTGLLRKELLNVTGIGEETADSILCYGFSRPSFVIDAYTERQVSCMGVTERKTALKGIFEDVLEKDNRVYRRVHAQIVEYGKEFCGKKRCSACMLVNSSG